jgi:uncharacterized protein DUF6326
MDPQPPRTGLDDIRVHVRVKLSLLWVSVMLCYVYGDYFELYTPGKLQSMLEGRMVPLGPVTQGVLFGAALTMAIPSLMVFLSIALSPAVSRLANIVFGTVYSIIMIALAIGTTWTFYRFLAVVETVLTLLVVRYAWTWPRRRTPEA